jgi:hypothetical protein
MTFNSLKKLLWVFILTFCLSALATSACHDWETDEKQFEDDGCRDNDGDGYGVGSDCIDSDCDDRDGFLYQELEGYQDEDEDSYGAGSELDVCSGDSLPDGYSTNDEDCEDQDEDIFPGAGESGNSLCTDGDDNDCDGDTDTADSGCAEGCADSDDDGYGEGMDCDGPDCNDADDSAWQNKEGYVDSDEDGYTVGGVGQVCSGSSLPSGYSSTRSNTDDCDDSDSTIYQNITGYTDNDHDGYGYGSSQLACSGNSLSTGYANNNDDCNDSDADCHTGTCCYNCIDNDGDDYNAYDATWCPTGDDECPSDPDNWTVSGCQNCEDADGDGWFAGCDRYFSIQGPDSCDDYTGSNEYNWTTAGCTYCTDNDEDGYGTNCDQGEDCDDDVESIHSGCSDFTTVVFAEEYKIVNKTDFESGLHEVFYRDYSFLSVAYNYTYDPVEGEGIEYEYSFLRFENFWEAGMPYGAIVDNVKLCLYNRVMYGDSPFEFNVCEVLGNWNYFYDPSYDCASPLATIYWQETQSSRCFYIYNYSTQDIFGLNGIMLMPQNSMGDLSFHYSDVPSEAPKLFVEWHE